MFTGIVAGVGRVVPAAEGRLGIEYPPVAAAAQPGASVAVNGACLTVVEVAGAAFFADVVAETLSRTNLGALRPGDPVNIELPLRLDQGLDGHLVQGHVDGVGTVVAIHPMPAGRELTIEVPEPLRRFIAEKGSVAVDGTSLTVAGLDAAGGRFTVALIPHTLAATVASGYVPGSRVNIEVDVLARYAARLLGVK